MSMLNLSFLLVALFSLLRASSSAPLPGFADFPDCVQGPGASWPICDSSLSPAARAADLVSRMNLTERLIRLGYDCPGLPHLGLPHYSFGTEGLHGIASGTQFTQSGDFSSSTLFPTPINSAAAFDRELWHSIATWISNEARAFNNDGRTGLHFWAPNINIVRDPRWGRAHETSGEDPYLTGQYALQYVRGMQEGVDGRYLKVVSTCKHWLAYDLETGDDGVDRHHFDAAVSELDLAETHLPAFESCVRDAKAAGIMCSYNEVNGVPTCSSPLFEQALLRDEWGFDGTVVSDCGAIEDISDNHRYAADATHAVALALNAGTDMECQFGEMYYQTHGQAAIDAGLLTEQRVDQAVARAYETLIRLGYFDAAADQPYRRIDHTYWNSSEAHAVSLRAAREGLVLLKNDAASLPIDSDRVKTIAVIGHAANESLVGPYVVQSPYDISILQGMREAGAARGVRVQYALGCYILDNDTSHFDEAIALAKTADLVVFVGGVNQTVSSEGNDQKSLALPGVQQQLVQELERVSKAPLITLVIGGVSTDISYLRDSPSVGSVLWIGFPGQDSGTAVASVLFGEYSPAGRLPITIYPAQYASEVRMGQMTMRASANGSYPGRTYKFYTGEPVYPFGWGLSYSNFTYSYTDTNQHGGATRSFDVSELASHFDRSGLHLSSAAPPNFHYIVNVTNSGPVTSDATVLAFLSASVRPSASHLATSPPLTQLVDFTRLHALAPGQSAAAVFTLQYRALAHVDEVGHSWLLPGDYRVTVGREAHAGSGQEGEGNGVEFAFSLTGAPKLIHRSLTSLAGNVSERSMQRGVVSSVTE